MAVVLSFGILVLLSINGGTRLPIFVVVVTWICSQMISHFTGRVGISYSKHPWVVIDNKIVELDWWVKRRICKHTHFYITNDDVEFRMNLSLTKDDVGKLRYSFPENVVKPIPDTLRLCCTDCNKVWELDQYKYQM